MFFVEYRKHVKATWKMLSTGEQSTFVITRLEPNTVYIVRMYSKTAAGESNRTEEIILRTGKTLNDCNCLCDTKCSKMVKNGYCRLHYL